MRPFFPADDALELVRQNLLHEVLQALGDPLAGLPITSLRQVLDLCCASGSWVLDVAFRSPSVEVAGIDPREAMIEYANARARSQQRANASFERMDLTQPLDFTEGSFDLLHGRFLAGVLPPAQWKTLFTESMRLLRPGGSLLLLETDGLLSVSSQALTQLNAYLRQAMAPYGFSPVSLMITGMLPRLFQEAGFEQIHLTPFVLDLSYDSPLWKEAFNSAELTYHQAIPAMLQQQLASAETLERLLRQMLQERCQETFSGLLYGLTISGRKPEDQRGR